MPSTKPSTAPRIAPPRLPSQLPNSMSFLPIHINGVISQLIAAPSALNTATTPLMTCPRIGIFPKKLINPLNPLTIMLTAPLISLGPRLRIFGIRPTKAPTKAPTAAPSAVPSGPKIVPTTPPITPPAAAPAIANLLKAF